MEKLITTKNQTVFLIVFFSGILILGFGLGKAEAQGKKTPAYSSGYYVIPFNQKISGTWYARVNGENKGEYADYTLSLVAFDDSEYEIQKAKDSKEAKMGMVYMPETQVSGLLTINIFPKIIDGNVLPKAEYKIPVRGIYMRNYLMLHNVSYSENEGIITQINYMVYNLVNGVLEGDYFVLTPFAISSNTNAAKIKINFSRRKP